MSENRNRGIQDFTKYDTMATEDLEEILRSDASAPMEQESDTELLLYVMEVLENRRRNNKCPGKNAFEAWESFQQHYLPAEEGLHKNISESPKTVRRFVSWPRRLIVAAAALALIISLPLTANAFSWEDVWEAVAKWAKETFSFVSNENVEVSEPDTEDTLQYTSLQDALIRDKIDPSIIPAKLPSGAVLEHIDKEITPIQRIYTALYRIDSKPFRIRVQSYIDADPEKVEVNDTLIELYEAGGVEYYIFANMGQVRAVWIINKCECNISGELSVEEIKAMIDSIEKG